VSAATPSVRTGSAELLLELYDAAIAAAAPDAVTARAVDAIEIDRASRIWVFAFGKAAAPMAAAAVASLLKGLHSIVGGVIVSPDAVTPAYPTLLSMRGDHPIPGQHSFAAAAKIAEVWSTLNWKGWPCSTSAGGSQWLL